MQALDRIETLLVELACAHPGRRSSSTTTGAARRSSRRPPVAAYVELGLMEIRRYGADSPQVVRRLHAVYDRLSEVAGAGERDRVDLERRLLAEAVAAAFPDPEERRIVEQADRLGLGFER